MAHCVYFWMKWETTNTSWREMILNLTEALTQIGQTPSCGSWVLGIILGFSYTCEMFHSTIKKTLAWWAHFAREQNNFAPSRPYSPYLKGKEATDWLTDWLTQKRLLPDDNHIIIIFSFWHVFIVGWLFAGWLPNPTSEQWSLTHAT